MADFDQQMIHPVYHNSDASLRVNDGPPTRVPRAPVRRSKTQGAYPLGSYPLRTPIRQLITVPQQTTFATKRDRDVAQMVHEDDLAGDRYDARNNPQRNVAIIRAKPGSDAAEIASKALDKHHPGLLPDDVRLQHELAIAAKTPLPKTATIPLTPKKHGVVPRSPVAQKARKRLFVDDNIGLLGGGPPKKPYVAHGPTTFEDVKAAFKGATKGIYDSAVADYRGIKKAYGDVKGPLTKLSQKALNALGLKVNALKLRKGAEKYAFRIATKAKGAAKRLLVGGRPSAKHIARVKKAAKKYPFKFE